MRNFIILFFVLNLSAFSNGLSQGVAFVEFKDANLYEVFESLKEQTGYGVLYRESEIDESVRVNKTFEDSNVYEVLDEALENTGLTFRVQDEVIVILKETTRPETPVAKQEKKSLKGKVTDEEGIPLPGVSVVIRGTNIGVATNIDGEYSLEFEKENAVLVFSFVGMIPQEYAYEGQTALDVTLTADSEQMAEVVVTGYQTISKERATGSFDKVEVAQIEKPASSISERLVGQLAGVQSKLNEDGSLDFEIRGQSSLYADAQPLIVVDGFPLEQEDIDTDRDALDGNDFNFNPFSTINPNDIESITVLKDAAAASIWGARSANGVIVITTKKAKKGKPKVSVSSFVKMSPKLDLQYVNPLGTAAERVAWEKRAFETDNFGAGRALLPHYPWNASSRKSLASMAMNEHALGNITLEERDATLARLSSLNNKKQIKDNLLQNPVTHQHNISISGGSETMQHMFSVMYENSKDNYKENSKDRFIVNYRTKVKATKWLDVDFSGMLQMNEATNNGVNMSEIKRLAPYDMLKNEDGSLANLNHTYFYTPILESVIPTHLFPYPDWSYNPITEIKNRDRTVKDINTRIQAGLTFKLFKGLTYNSSIQYELYNTKERAYYNEKTFELRRTVNTTSTWDFNPASKPVQNIPSGGMLRLGTGSSWDRKPANMVEIRAYNLRNQVNFVRTFNEKHSVNAVIGSEIRNRVAETTSNPTTYGFDDDRLSVGQFLNGNDVRGWNGWPAIYLADMSYINQYTYTTDRYFSLYANAAYTYNDKYTVSGSIRTDASNIIVDDASRRYSPFWSIGGTWQMSKEDFMSEIDWVDRLTLRATYGFNGNVDKSTSPVPLVSALPARDIYTFDKKARISSYGNPTLSWEKTGSLNIGIDYSLFRGKLFGNIDVYNKQSKDLIVLQNIPAFQGTTSNKLNSGEMYNRGIELSVGTKLPLKGNDIVWTGNLNFSYNKNKITKLFKSSYQFYNLTRGGSGSYVEGNDANTLYSLEYAGMLNQGTEANPHFTPSFYGLNGAQYNMLSWPPPVDARGYVKNEGTRVAPYLLGFSNSFKIYDFDLSFIVTGKFGHKFRRLGFNYAEGVNEMYSEAANSDGSKIIPLPGDNEPRSYFWDRFHPYMSYLTEDASHIRFQEVNLSYNLPKNLLRKIGLNSASIYAQANNLGTILFNDFNEDPEYPKGTFKPQASYTFGLKFNL
jgi:TonB-linked SusC/RagA family outer membrane protein